MSVTSLQRVAVSLDLTIRQTSLSFADRVTLVKMQSPMDDADDEADAPGSDPLGESGE